MRRALLPALFLVLLTCRKPAPVVVDAGVAAAPVLRPLPVTPTLSWLEPTRENTCEWITLELASQQRASIATFPGTCLGARLAWTPDTSKALAWFDPQFHPASYGAPSASAPAWPDEPLDEHATARLFFVDVRAGRFESLALPGLSAGEQLEDLGLGAEGVPLAFTTQDLSDAEVEAKQAKADGQTFDLSSITEGAPALARAYRWQQGRWSRFETKLTTTGWDYAAGAGELDAYKTAGARSSDLSESRLGGDAADDAEVKALSTLRPPKATDDDGQWVFVGAGGQRVYVWEITAEFAYSTGLLVTGTPPAKLKDLRFTDGDLVAVRTSGPFLLVTQAGGAHLQLYRLPEAKQVYAASTSRAATFWPGTARPEGHESPKE